MKCNRILALLLISVLLLPSLASCVNMDARSSNHRHEYGDWIIIQEPTYDNTGLQERRCDCGKTETEIIPRLTGDEYPTEREGDLLLYTVGYFAPFTYYQVGVLRGIEIDIAQEIADRMNRNLVMDDVEFDSIIHHVAEPTDYNAIRIGMSGITVTDQRLETVSFSYVYLTHRMVVVTQEGRFEHVDDFNTKSGLLVGAVDGTAEQIYGEYHASQVGNSFERFSTYREAVENLASGYADALLLPEEVLPYLDLSSAGLAVLEGYHTEESYAIAIHKDDVDLQERLNGIIMDMRNDGTLDKLVQQYYSEWAER